MTLASPLSEPRRSPRGRAEFRLTGWHVLAILGGLFGVMLAVNTVFVVAALSTHSGETRYAYMKGLNFNEVLAEERAQSALGWSMRIELVRPANAPARLVATLSERDGSPLTGAGITALVGRPATQAEDATLSFTETSPGHYEASAPMLGPGAWRFEATATKPGQPALKAETRLSLR